MRLALALFKAELQYWHDLGWLWLAKLKLDREKRTLDKIQQALVR